MPTAFDRLAYTSRAVSFGDKEALRALGSGSVTLRCPQCDAVGERFGNPGQEMRFVGFEPLSRGGVRYILCRCAACGEEVTLPHRPAEG